jgi:hypothetical protein
VKAPLGRFIQDAIFLGAAQLCNESIVEALDIYQAYRFVGHALLSNESSDAFTTYAIILDLKAKEFATNAFPKLVECT